MPRGACKRGSRVETTGRARARPGLALAMVRPCTKRGRAGRAVSHEHGAQAEKSSGISALAPTMLLRSGMTAETYRSSQPPARAPRGLRLERDVAFIALLLVTAALVDVIGVARRGAPFTGLHAVAMLTLMAPVLAALLAGARALARTVASARSRAQR